AEAGGNRTNWDLRADAPPAFTHTFEINANPGLTPPSPLGPLVPPGAYTLRLTVDGKTYIQPVTVVNDPRSPATAADVRAQYALETGDLAPTPAMEAAYAAACKDLAKAVTTFNAVLVQHQLKQAALAAPRCGG